MALLLKSKGYKTVWPLLGGFDAWLELGYPTEPFRAGEGLRNRVSAAGPSVSKEQDNSWA
jgi:3-mercaptopyruvate sulfurtransferase SseA